MPNSYFHARARVERFHSYAAVAAGHFRETMPKGKKPMLKEREIETGEKQRALLLQKGRPQSGKNSRQTWSEGGKAVPTQT